MDAKNNKSTETLKISENWSQQSDNLKEKFPQLTDADLKFQTGKEEDFIKRLEMRLHKKRNEIINIIRKSQPAIA